jgi:hypothetical protein
MFCLDINTGTREKKYCGLVGSKAWQKKILEKYILIFYHMKEIKRSSKKRNKIA